MVACKHLVQHDCTTILVAAWIDDAAGLLRCHVADCATHSDSLANLCAWLQRAGDAEVGDHQSVVLLMNQDVLRLNIAMDDRARSCMCVVERVYKLMEVMNGLSRGKWPIGLG